LGTEAQGEAMASVPIEKTDPLADLVSATRARSLALAEPLSDADATVQSMPDASPAKWHLAHTTWFFETFVLRDHVADYALFDADWPFLFNSYYDAEGERHARSARGMLTRPSLAEVCTYRAHVDAALSAALPGLSATVRDLVELGCHHEAQHQELLLTDILHLFAQNPLSPAYRPARRAMATPSVAPTPQGWIEGAAGIAEAGHDADRFAFDCEAPRHRTYLGRHAIGERLVSNGDWLRFVTDGGYERPALWLSDGWSWVRAEGIEGPLYWRGDDEFTLEGLRLRAPADPVTHISFYEADAYARWAGARLPTEFEWEAGAARLPDAFGRVWQWTASAFLPYPGFTADAGAVGEYNGKFMSGQMVLRGSSHATPDGTSRITTRNFFPPAARWQFAGLRLAKDL
jgi:ergothioneine biosynthesis protein EgtB